MLQAHHVFRRTRSFPTAVHTRQAVASNSRRLWTQEDSSRASLVLFDIANDRAPCSLQSAHSASSPHSQKSFSPNTIRARLALHYKGVPYTQSWISYPDIERLWAELGIPPNEGQPKGVPRCTLPVLLVRTEAFSQASLRRLDDTNVLGWPKKSLDTKYGTFTPLVSTLEIAHALDSLFHDRDLHPPLFPSGQSYEQGQQMQSVITRLLPATRRLILPSVPDILDARGKDYFIRTRIQWFNVSSLDELRPQSQDETDKLWAEIENILQPVIRTLQESPSQEGPLLNDPLTWEDHRDDRSLGNSRYEAVRRDASASASAHATAHEPGRDSRHVRYLSGASTPTYADFILMAFLAWIARVDMHAWARLTQDVGGGVLEDLWMGCLPYMRSHTYVRTLSWFKGGTPVAPGM
ncbi:hypothetical protein G647_05102 [Cladophialophora carrionii CBS 160.54]|uniref:Uncharacterized protein n=1 Tax=Cladophialophora carrionii CBS 160.54 TaxID=1279043 RepID=V9DBF8_9EURO|nr:uncharacterized protein G647_05102 [Cladophialophora carrionii CBS 160.54]ETI23302.1 hypothetical protein G647_05102 [Cladophialophora carrionii CBS 160.54]